MEFELFTQAFCGPCLRARAVLAEAERLVPGLTVVERDVAREPRRAEAAGVRSTPTVLVRNAAGETVFRAEGAPTLDQALRAAACAVPRP